MEGRSDDAVGGISPGAGRPAQDGVGVRGVEQIEDHVHSPQALRGQLESLPDGHVPQTERGKDILGFAATFNLERDVPLNRLSATGLGAGLPEWNKRIARNLIAPAA